MKRQELMEMDDDRLIWICAEPVISKARAKSGPEKLQVFRDLSDGQRALFMFQVLHGHMEHGTVGFYDHIAYLVNQMNVWSALKSGMRYFGADGMLDLIEKMEEDYSCREKGRTDNGITEELDEAYRNLIPAMLRDVARRIRNHPDDFIRLED